MLKKLPVGLQSITEIIEGGYIYVDKTKYALELIENGKYYFMSRPRRFGKSLFISTLKEILSGNKTLFQECDIAKSDYDWKAYPILHFDFSQIPSRTPEMLEQGLLERVQEMASFYNISVEGSSLQFRLEGLIKQLSKSGKVVFLVDEYDKPIVDNLMRMDVADSNRDLLRSFFGTLKGLDEYLKLVFVTGISKFSQVSLFSGLNNLEILTMEPTYSTLMGYTKEEIKTFFGGYIQQIAKKRNITLQQVLSELKEWYNGYCFTEDRQLVYNPFSTLLYFKKGRPCGYWFSSGTPSFLIDQIQNRPTAAVELSGAKVKRSQLQDIQNVAKMDLRALMWQTGYLTICGYDEEIDIFELDFPNREVRGAFFDILLQEFEEALPAEVTVHGANVRKHLFDCNFDQFFKAINSYYAKIPYHLFTSAKEGFYHAVLLSLLEGMSLKVRAEDPTNIGRIDLVIETSEMVYIFELKVGQTADIAIQQAELNKYCEKYCHQNRKIVLIGLNFNPDTRNISDWTAKSYSSSGAVLQSLRSLHAKTS